MSCIAIESETQPYLVASYQWKNFFIRYRILMPYDKKLFLILHQLRHIFTEQRKGRISNDNISLFQKFNAFLATEIAITFQRFHAYLFGIRGMVAVLVAFVDKINGTLAFVLAEEVHVLIFIACGYEFLQSKKFKVVGEISEEIAHTRVVAVAQYCLSAKMVAIMTQFVVDVFELCVKLVFLCRLSPVDCTFCHN